jgi:hypothetical protein
MLMQLIASGERHRTFLPRLSTILPISAHQSNKKGVEMPTFFERDRTWLP